MKQALYVHHVLADTDVVTGPPVLFLHGLASRGRVDWPDAEWATPLAARGRESVVVDLPVHGSSFRPPQPLTPSAIVDLLEEVVHSVGGLVDVVAYSLGSRLAWDLIARGGVRRAVLGGLSPRIDFGVVDLAAARAALRGGSAPRDEFTRLILGMAQLPGLDPTEVLRLVEGLAREPFKPMGQAGPGAAHGARMLFVRGADDQLSLGLDRLAAQVPGAQYREITGDHLNALHTRQFRAAATDFLF